MPKRDDIFSQFGKYYGLAFLIPSSVLVGYGIGYGLDKYFGTTYLKMVFLLLGIVSGMVQLIRELNKDDAGSEPGSYDGFIRRVQWIILALGLAGAVALSISQGIRSGGAFLVGAAISFSSFWGWQRVVDGLGPNPRQRGRLFFVLRLIALVGLAWVIIKYLQLNVAAAAIGLLVSGAAVVLELIYEMIYAS